jgi:hypothetical protein
VHSPAAGDTEPMPVPSDDSQASGHGGEHPLQLPAIDIPSIELKPPVPAETSPLPMAAEAPSAVPSPAGHGGAPTNRGGDVGSRLAAALNASETLDTAVNPPAAKKRPLMADFYRTLAGLGEALAWSDPNDDKVAESVTSAGELLRKVGSQPERLTLIAAATPSWMESRRPHNGICLVGRVQSVAARGEFNEAILELIDGRAMTVIMRREPTRELAGGTTVLVLGALLDAPADTLAGYAGDAKNAVLEGLSLPLPANGLP